MSYTGMKMIEEAVDDPSSSFLVSICGFSTITGLPAGLPTLR